MKNKKLITTPGIKWKVFGYFALFVAILVLLLWLFQIVFLESFYKAIKTQNIKSAAASISDSLNSDNYKAVLEGIARKNEMCVLVLNLGEEVVYSVDIMPSCTIHHLKADQLYQLYEVAKTQDVVILEDVDEMQRWGNLLKDDGHRDLFAMPPTGAMRTKDQSMIYAMVVETDDGQNVLILLNTMITPVSSTVETLRIQLIWITGILIVLSAVIALLLSLKITRPIVKTNDAAKKLAQGKYEPPKGSGGYREIKELNATLNYAASELEKVESLRRELVANVSHDLRTPLTMISGYAEMMRDIPGENTPQNVQIIIDEANRLSTLVTDILDLSRLQSGVRRPQPEYFSLTQDIRDTLARYNKLREAEGYLIEFDYTEEITVYADRIEISQVVYNLVNNAIAYTGDDRKVFIRQTVNDGWVRVEVTDTGPGIDEENLPYIWDRYYKGKETHKRAIIGTGLGLSISRSVLESHHARYGVISEKGKGSTFWFELPVTERTDEKNR